MKKNVFSMREDSMNNTVRGLDKCYVEGDATGKSIPGKFAGMKNAGLFDMGINTINKQVNSITNSIFNVKNIVKKHSTEMFDMDRGMARAARNIEIPQDFVTTEANQVNTFNSYLLEKMDGKSVNAGQALGSVAPVADSIISSQKTLGNINNTVAINEQQLDASTVISNKRLGNIDKNNTTNEQKINEATGIVSQVLKDVGNQNGISEQQLDSSTAISKSLLNEVDVDSKGLSNQYLDLNLDTVGVNISNVAGNASNIMNNNIKFDEGLEKIDVIEDNDSN